MCSGVFSKSLINFSSAVERGSALIASVLCKKSSCHFKKNVKFLFFLEAMMFFSSVGLLNEFSS